jgi:hypothetical protein
MKAHFSETTSKQEWNKRRPLEVDKGSLPLMIGSEGWYDIASRNSSVCEVLLG